MNKSRKKLMNMPPPGRIRWGVWDTKDECWVGGEDGPKLFDYPDIARVAAQILGVQMGWPPKRAQSRMYDGHGAKKDELPMPMTTAAALRKVEDGAL